jgi:hypothetical protein
LFIDVSGSCRGFVRKFAAEARRIPKQHYDIECWAFDTALIEFDLKGTKVPYGGGTSFHQLEEYLCKRPKYPDLVFVMTDGDGTTVKPRLPNRWHVFLTYDHRSCFPTVKNFHKMDITPESV